MLGDLVRQGFDVVDDHEDADAIVINTCAFVEDAKAESISVRQGAAGPASLHWLPCWRAAGMSAPAEAPLLLSFHLCNTHERTGTGTHTHTRTHIHTSTRTCTSEE